MVNKMEKKMENRLIPDTRDSDRFVTKENSLRILNCKLMLFILTVNTVIFKHVGLQSETPKTI